MALKSFKPTTPAQRQLVIVDRSELYKGKPVKALTEGKTKSGGRNHHGRLTAFRVGGGHKQSYRIIDFKRRKFDVSAVVERIEYALGPGGHFVLPGPDPARLPVRQTGGYLVLLRIEAVPAGTHFGVAAEHGAAPFSLPVLVYQVGAGIDGSTALAARFVELIDVQPGRVPTLARRALAEAASWRVELADANGIIVGSKFLRREQTRYDLTGVLAQRTQGKAVQWRVQAFDAGRKPIGRSDWKDIKAS